MQLKPKLSQKFPATLKRMAHKQTMNMKTGQMVDLNIDGRHDTCIALRVPVVIEAATSIVLADLMLQAQQTTKVFTK